MASSTHKPLEGDGSLNSLFESISLARFARPPQIIVVEEDESIASAVMKLSVHNVLCAPIRSKAVPEDAPWHEVGHFL